MSAQAKNNNFEVSLFYDGLCHLCSREINHYKKLKGSEKINFVDITLANFDAKAEGLDPVAVNKYLHVKTKDGKIVTGVASFLEVWKQLPAYTWLAKLVSFMPIRKVADLGYMIFAEIRPLLPKKESCETSPYCETHGEQK